ncbi:hypothetical protein CQ017_15565, partial [Arthrobacter sp. MYb224]|uniref:hypothetical protein n=1 Tax=Arthrobacter sp. MYb224 TaxID=1848600 RepID=UPI000D428584
MMSEKSGRISDLGRVIKSTYVLSMFLLSFIILGLIITIWVIESNPSTLVLSLGILTSAVLLIALLFKYFSTQRHFLQQGRIDSRLKSMELKLSKYRDSVLLEAKNKETKALSDQTRNNGEKAADLDLEIPAKASVVAAPKAGVAKSVPVVPATASVVAAPKAGVAKSVPVVAAPKAGVA